MNLQPIENTITITTWKCQQCTLINKIKDSICRVCGFPRPTPNESNGFLHRFGLPHFSISSALDKLDSALGLVSNALTTPDSNSQDRNVNFYPQFSPSSSNGGLADKSSWSCANCSQLNSHGKRICVWCDSEQAQDVTNSYWICSRCALRQPLPPLNLKCPLCRTKSSGRALGTSRSMPHLNGEIASGLDVAPNLTEQAVAGQEAVVSGEKFNGIIRFCRNNNQSFVDDAFPHSARSIGSQSRFSKKMKNMEIVWLRPDKIVTRDGRRTRWSVFNDPQSTDIEQGLLGNCWFLSALAVVSERPDILEKLFLTKEYNHFGVYEMRLCIDGVWQNVIVDDFFPCHKRQRSMIFAVGRKNQLWVSLIEKALAKVYGNYAALIAGRTIEGLSTLTGASTLSLDLECEESDWQRRQCALDLVWAKLLSARDARFLMGCSCGAGKRPVDEQEYRRMGLMSQHAYSLLDVRQTTDGHRMVLLRNPWGTFVWLGEFGHGWPGWTPRLVEQLASEATAQPGTFWIPFERFVHYFDTVDIAQIREHGGWVSTRYLLDLGWESGKTRMVRMTITEPTELCVTLHQKNARTATDQVDIMVVVHRQHHSRDSFPGEQVCRSPRKIQPSVRTDDMFFQPGEYLLCAHSFSKFGDKMVPSALVIHSSKKIFTEILSSTLDALHQSICSLILKEGQIQNTYSGPTVRYLIEDFGGLALMVDNPSPNRCVQVSSDCHNSSNVLSTRSSLAAFDSIPPLHRQVLTLLTHFEPSQAYIVGHKLFHRTTAFPQLRDYAPSPEFGGMQNFPPLLGPSVGALHGPSPLYV